MTLEEFSNTRFGFGMRAIYKGQVYLVKTVDFEESLLGLLLPDNQEGDDWEVSWVRCENIELIKF
jgi:hypothetical protein